MSALIVTNDSQMFFPGRNGRPRRGVPFDSLSAKERDLALPVCEILGGRFTEVRRLWERVNEMLPTELCVISAEHGIISSDVTIAPYRRRVETLGEVRELEERTAFASDIARRVERTGKAIVLLSRPFMTLLLEKGAFDHLETGAVVTSRRLFDHFGEDVLVLERKGARVGRDNADRILDLIEGWSLTSDHP